MNSFNQSPILMYHGITAPGVIVPPDREAGAELYDVSEEKFQKQMRWLQDNGYYAGTMSLDILSVPDSNKIILTFDDGEMNNFSQVLPILREAKFSAYFFIIGKRIGKPGYLGWNELRKMHEAGMVIGSHGLTHEILTRLLDTQVEEELLASKKYLERNLGIRVNTLSIPRGFCNEKIIRMAHKIGYTEVFVSDKFSGIQSPCYARIAVKGIWSLEYFVKAIKGQRSLMEKTFDGFKNALKFVLRGTGYNCLRGVVLKIIR